MEVVSQVVADAQIHVVESRTKVTAIQCEEDGSTAENQTASDNTVLFEA